MRAREHLLHFAELCGHFGVGFEDASGATNRRFVAHKEGCDARGVVSRHAAGEIDGAVSRDDDIGPARGTFEIVFGELEDACGDGGDGLERWCLRPEVSLLINLSRDQSIGKLVLSTQRRYRDESVG